MGFPFFALFLHVALFLLEFMIVYEFFWEVGPALPPKLAKEQAFSLVTTGCIISLLLHVPLWKNIKIYLPNIHVVQAATHSRVHSSDAIKNCQSFNLVPSLRVYHVSLK